MKYENTHVVCDITADQCSTPGDTGHQKNTTNTLNKQRLLSTITVCHERVIKVHLLL